MDSAVKKKYVALLFGIYLQGTKRSRMNNLSKNHSKHILGYRKLEAFLFYQNSDLNRCEIVRF